jgi:hypothetical protein
LENKALLACKSPALEGTRVYELMREKIDKAVEFEVPPYYLASGALEEPLSAPSALVHGVRVKLIDEN